MTKRSLAAALAVTCIASTPVFGESPLAESLTPNLALGLQFGAGHHDAVPTRFTARFDVRSQLLRRDLDLARETLATDRTTDLTMFGVGVPLVRVLELGTGHQGVELVNVLGYDMVGTNDPLNETGESPWYSHKWIWWTAGGIVAAGAALAAAGGSHHGYDGNTGGGGGNSGDCNVVSGSNIPPQPGDPPPTILGPDCPGVPKH